MKPTVDYTLYLCTDRQLMRTQTVEDSVEQALRGGCSVVQLREKDCSSRDFYEIACRVKEITQKYRVPLIINDRIDIALAADAEGVHLGQSDLPCPAARRLLGAGKIIGISANTVADAVRAEQEGADYIGFGAVYPTGTKKDAKPASLDVFEDIRSCIELPIVAIGGVCRDNAAALHTAGFDGIAVISAIVAQPDIESAARGIRAAFMGEAHA